MTSVFGLLQHIWLGFVHVLALLFLPSHRSFQTVHELTDAGYRASYLDHCRTQHNVRFGTLAYSLVLACTIAFVTASVQIIYPEQFNRPVYAATLTVNSSGDDNDGSCAAAPGDCTLREAVEVANVGDIIDFSSDMIITLGSTLSIVDNQVSIITTSRSIILDCNDNQSFDFALSINADTVSVQALEIRKCKSAVNVQGDDVSLHGLVMKNNRETMLIGQVDGTLVDAPVIDGGANGGTGILLSGSTNTTIRTGTIRSLQNGVDVRQAAANNTIQTNTIYDIDSTAILVEDTSNNLVVRDNKIGVDGQAGNLPTAKGIELSAESANIT